MIKSIGKINVKKKSDWLQSASSCFDDDDDDDDDDEDDDDDDGGGGGGGLKTVVSMNLSGKISKADQRQGWGEGQRIISPFLSVASSRNESAIMHEVH